VPRLKPSALIIGVIACVPVLALHRLGLFDEMGAALLRLYREHFQADDLQAAPLLQYGWHTVAAFVSAWVCLELPRQLQRFAFLFGLVFMTALLSRAGLGRHPL